MNKQRMTELRDFYRDTLLDDVLPFWMRHIRDDEYGVYVPLADRLAPRVQPPSVLVHLEASNALLLARIAKRGREFEQGMDADFLSAMRQAYTTLEELVDCPLIRVNCDATDLRRTDARADLVERIRETL